MTKVLVLRPQPGADATVERALTLGLDARAVPLFQIGPVTWEAPEPGSFDGLLLTSANAVRMAGEQVKTLRGLKAYAVGEATAEAAREAGFDIAATGDAGIDRLLGSIEPDLRLLQLCGEERRGPGEAKQQITPVPVYRANAIETPALGDIRGVVALIHSPRAALRFAELVKARESIALVAISQAAADAAGEGWRDVEVAEQSSDEALLALATRLCDKPDPK